MKVVREALARRVGRLPPETTCFRWIDEELPGVTVDLFGDVAIASLYRPAPADEEAALAKALARARPLRAVYVKRRPQEARTSGRASGEVAPTAPVWGEPVELLHCREAGATFEIRPPNGLSVGLYLDARDARGWIRRHAEGREVLNTFAYTCGFAVAARRGGAKRAVNVDASRKVLDWGERNLALNASAVDRQDFLSGDALGWMGRMARRGQRFELVILDPPGFATSKTSRFSAQKDYHRLVAAASSVTREGGLVLAMCNVEAMSSADLDAHLRRGVGARPSRAVARFGASDVDFRQPSTLKCVALELS
ncbi:MAG: class I SAM-dependent rRNA methyltransferase [Myxococcales bacterium]|nr:class I SAM-dependent rRNA methyltransferase [Myxococcales bacterium]